MSEASTFAKCVIIISQEFSTSHEKLEENNIQVHSKNAYKQPTRRWAAFFGTFRLWLYIFERYSKYDSVEIINKMQPYIRIYYSTVH